MASIVELGDRLLITALWQHLNPPGRVKLQFVRIAGTGKRDGLAHGFRAISRNDPDERALVAVIDGDAILHPGILRKCAPMFHLLPNVGALTTNEFCTVRGGRLVSNWHKLRFAERHLNMCSMALTRRVLTLTGRMSLFRAAIVVDPRFIADVEYDSLLHWRLGRFRFLTGDDKSSWFSVVRLGWKTFYVPDAAIQTIEHPPDPSFVATSRQLMFRWYGNSMRQNGRARKLGPRQLGWVHLLRAPGSARADVDGFARPDRGNAREHPLRLPLPHCLRRMGRAHALLDVPDPEGRGSPHRAAVRALDVLQPGRRLVHQDRPPRVFRIGSRGRGRRPRSRAISTGFTRGSTPGPRASCCSVRPAFSLRSLPRSFCSSRVYR